MGTPMSGARWNSRDKLKARQKKQTQRKTALVGMQCTSPRGGSNPARELSEPRRVDCELGRNTLVGAEEASFPFAPRSKDHGAPLRRHPRARPSIGPA